MNICLILTVQPLRVVFQGPLEFILQPFSRSIIQISAENNRVRLGELGIGARVLRRRKFTASVRVRESFSLCEQFAYQAGQATRIAVLHINRSGVVEGIVGALGNAQAHANHIFRARQVSQIRLGFESRRKG